MEQILGEKPLSDDYPVGSKKWHQAKDIEHYRWVKQFIESSGDLSPIRVKLDYALGWLDNEVPE